MLERFYRSKAQPLQRMYDRVPGPLRSAMVSVRGISLARNRYSADAMGQLSELIACERLSRDEVEVSTLTRLQALLETARRHCSHYRDYPDVRVKSFSDWAQLPVLTREDVRRNPEGLVNESIPAGKRIWVSTTGTTGASARVSYTQEVMRRNWVFRMQQFQWAGLQCPTPRITLFGSRVIPASQTEPPFWVHNAAERQILVSIYHLSPRTARHYAAFFSRHAGWVVEGFPSALSILSEFLGDAGEVVPMRAVFTDGEPLHEFEREKLERTFATRVYNTYGNTELCGLIQQCACEGMHLNEQYGHLEVLDENNKPVPPGGAGYLVWTGFVNDSSLFLRYRLGDRGGWIEQQRCACGRNSPLVDPGLTRESDLLHGSEGRVFSPRAVNQVLKGTTGFRFCQFVQRDSGRVLIRAVGEGEQARRELERVREGVLSLMGTGCAVEVELAGAPVVRPGGKVPLIIQEKYSKSYGRG